MAKLKKVVKQIMMGSVMAAALIGAVMGAQPAPPDVAKPSSVKIQRIASLPAALESQHDTQYNNQHGIGSDSGANPNSQWLAITLHLQPGWHTYAKDPGDIGIPPEFRFESSHPLAFSDIVYEAPTRFESDGWVSYGYESVATFYVNATFKKGRIPKLTDPITITVNAKWVECKIDCVPKSGSARLTFWPHDAIQHDESYTVDSEWTEQKKLQADPQTQHNQSSLSIQRWRFMALAFLGGLLLNIMPCVFPVLSIKLLHLLNASLNFKARLVVSFGYTLGIVAAMWGLGGIGLLLKSTGYAVGWGFQMQSPVFITVMIVILSIMALSLLDWLKTPTVILTKTSAAATWIQHLISKKSKQKKSSSNKNDKSNKIQNKTDNTQKSLKTPKDVHRDTLLRDNILLGILAVVVSTPCTAPFMGTALGFGLAQPAWVMLGILTALGLGLAAPYGLLSLFPVWIRRLPKPGPWMEKVKKIMAIPIILTVIWLGWVLSIQLSKQTDPFFNPNAIQTALKEGPVFVEVTAAWCLTCQTNKWVLNSQEVTRLFDENDVTRITADWTDYDPEITRYLASVGRDGVPTYVLYSPKAGYDHPVVLSEVLTKDRLAAEIAKINTMQKNALFRHLGKPPIMRDQ